MRPGRLVIPGLFGFATLAAASAVPFGTAWAGPAEICSNAGYRMGSAAFDMCVDRLTQDDPLAALDRAMETSEAKEVEGGETEGTEPVVDMLGPPVVGFEPERGKATAVPFKPPPRPDGELPPSTPTTAPSGFGSLPANGGGSLPSQPPPLPSSPPSPPPSAPSGMTTPTAPTAPTAPTFPFFTMPSWNWSD